ncbi:MAG: hypothetical protein R2726_17295 [Acidimicrobiales bacterium]
MERATIEAIARRRADPAVTVLAPVPQPVAAHPEVSPRLRALVDRAVAAVAAQRGGEVAAAVRAQLDAVDLGLRTGEHAHGLAVLASAESCEVLRLPFAVDEQVTVNRSFATRQLLTGLARSPWYRVLSIAGHRARLLEGQGGHLVEIAAGGFPIDVAPPHEWDTPHKDQPIHEEAEHEEHRIVQRAVDAALGAAVDRDPLPLVVVAATRELAYFDEVTTHAAQVVGHVRGSYGRATPAELAAAVQPALDAHLAARRAEAVERLRRALGAGRAATGLPAVDESARAGRGHELVVEEGFSFPRHWVDGVVGAATEPEPVLELDDVVDDVIEAVLLDGGEVSFVDPDALDDVGHIGLVLRH